MKKLLFILLIPLLCLTTSCTKKEVEKEVLEIDGVTYKQTEDVTNYVKITMEDGEVIIAELYPDIAPITVANFQKLVQEKFYDKLTFHRIYKGFVIQGGDPNGDGTGGSSETITGEFRRNGITNNLKHERGVLSMARNSVDMNSASSQFFICLANSTAKQLDGEYAAFGRVIAGMDVVDNLANSEIVEGTQDTPVKKPVIYSIRFVNIEE